MIFDNKQFILLSVLTLSAVPAKGMEQDEQKGSSHVSRIRELEDQLANEKIIHQKEVSFLEERVGKLQCHIMHLQSQIAFKLNLELDCSRARRFVEKAKEKLTHLKNVWEEHERVLQRHTDMWKKSEGQREDAKIVFQKALEYEKDITGRLHESSKECIWSRNALEESRKEYEFACREYRRLSDIVFDDSCRAKIAKENYLAEEEHLRQQEAELVYKTALQEKNG